MANRDRYTVKVAVAGREFSLSTDEDEVYVHRLADSVTARIYEFKRQTGASTLDCAALTAFCLADEVHKLSARLERAQKPRSAKSKPDGAAPPEKTGDEAQ